MSDLYRDHYLPARPGPGCTCTPCDTPYTAFPEYGEHCAACGCNSSEIGEYDPACPLPYHRELAALQHADVAPHASADQPGGSTG